MKGLIVKDLLNLKKYGRTSFIIIILYAVLMLSMDNAAFLSGMIILLFAMMPVTSFAYDDLAKWDRYACTLPVSRKDIVKSKYVLAVIMALSGTVFSIAAGSVTTFFGKANFMDILVSGYALFVVAILFLSLLLPLIYKFGVEKSRIMLIAIVAVPTAVIMLLSQTNLFSFNDEIIKLLMYLSPAFMVLAMGLSYFASYACFNKKDL